MTIVANKRVVVIGAGYVKPHIPDCGQNMIGLFGLSYGRSSIGGLAAAIALREKLDCDDFTVCMRIVPEAAW